MMDMRKIAIVGVLVAAFGGTPGSARAAVCGDLNGNGSADVADALILSNVVAGGSPPANVCGGSGISQCGDVFKDSSISNADLAVLVDTVAGLETLFDACSGPGSAIACPGGNVTLGTQTITASQVWPKSCTVLIGGTILVDTPAGAPTTVLTVERGSTVKGSVEAEDPAALIVLTGAKLNAQGTESEPIIFTSSAAPGSRTAGDWGGVMINGRSTVNRPNCQNQAEGLPEAYGGCDPHDSSGIIRYVRSEFSGRLFTPNNELNSFTMNGVGDGTIIDHVQGHFGSDDCIEWFGGTVRSRYMVASACGDDGFDWQLGWTGALQYGLQLQSPANFSAGNGESRGIEADNSEFGNNDLPRSDPDLCNLTFVGTKAAPGSDVGILLRRGTAGTIANAIVTNYLDAGVELRDASTTQQACIDAETLKSDRPNLRVRNSIFFSNGDDASEPAPNAEHCKNLSTPIANATCQPCEWYDLLVAKERVVNKNGENTVDPGQTTTYPETGALYAAKPTGTQVTPAACTAINEFFDNTTYVGAFDPAGPATGWLTQPWLNFDTN